MGKTHIFKNQKNDEPEFIPHLPLTKSQKQEVEEKWAKQVRDIKRKKSAEKAIRDAYWQSWDKLPSVWVARDDDGSLWIYTTKPIEGGGMFSCSATGDMFQIDSSVYPEITYENSPVKVKLLFIDA